MVWVYSLIEDFWKLWARPFVAPGFCGKRLRQVFLTSFRIHRSCQILAFGSMAGESAKPSSQCQVSVALIKLTVNYAILAFVTSAAGWFYRKHDETSRVSQAFDVWCAPYSDTSSIFT